MIGVDHTRVGVGMTDGAASATGAVLVSFFGATDFFGVAFFFGVVAFLVVFFFCAMRDTLVNSCPS